MDKRTGLNLTKHCKNCGEAFDASLRRADAKHCSDWCRTDSANKTQKGKREKFA